VGPEDGAVIQADAWTLTPDWLYFGQTSAGANAALMISSVVRVPLSELSSYAKAL
jgi:hypothetical protein